MCTKSGCVDISGFKTNVMTWGKWIEDPIADGENIVLIIPGNPGVSEFYTEFAEVIYNRTGFTVWVVAYAGHGITKDTHPFKYDVDKYGLKGQVEHKREFFKTYVPGNAKVHVVAHSIGAYQTLKLLPDSSVNDKISIAHLIFPAIENLALTRNGKFMLRFIKRIVWLICFLSAIFMVLPRQLQVILLTIYMFIVNLPRKEYLYDSCIRLITPFSLRNVFFLAFDEIDNLKDRDNEVIRNNLKKINFIYSDSDGWAPKSFYEELKAEIPEVRAKITNFEHAFVMRQSIEVGKFLSDEILERCSCKKVENNCK